MSGRSFCLLRAAFMAALLCTLSGASALATPDLPDPLYADTNGDGVDGDVSAAVFVDAATGADAPGNGAMAAPMRTVGYALSHASGNGLTQVLVAKGTYNEQVTCVNGISIYGGYDGPPLWGRSASNVTTLTWSGSTGADVVAVEASNLTLPTTIADVTIISGDAPAGESSYGVRAVGSPQLALLRDTIRSGAGGAGAAGANGADGADGGEGVNGWPGDCDSNSVIGYGGPGGASSCGVPGGAGGQGGSANGLYGLAGQPGSGGAAGGPGGSCGDPGWDGGRGGRGHNGSGGVAGSLGGYGGVVGTRWLPGVGGSGTAGQPGTSGAGGGGGGNQSCLFCDNGPGNGGGGGGAGGCGGGGGTGGVGGGASIAVLLVNSAGATIADCSLFTAAGGAGGAGGWGGDQGLGGSGGAGGQVCLGEVGAGGQGGTGGNGGYGGPGCAGNGGSAWCIYPHGGAPSCARNLYVPGSAGPPGAPGVNALGTFAYGVAGQRGAVYQGAASDWMKLSCARIPPAAPVQVTVNLVGSADCTVTANGVELAKINSNVFAGMLMSPPSAGPFPVVVSYQTSTLTETVQVQRALGLGRREALDLPDALLQQYMFRVWGRVLTITGNTLAVWDGGPSPVLVVADSALIKGVCVGCFVTARGILENGTPLPVLYADSVVNETPGGPPPLPLHDVTGAAH